MTTYTKRTVLFVAVSFAIGDCDAFPSAPVSATRGLGASAPGLATSVGVGDGDARVWRQLVERMSIKVFVSN